MMFLNVHDKMKDYMELSDVATPSPSKKGAFLPTTVVRYAIPERKPGYPWMELYGAIVAATSFLCCGIVQSYTSGAIYSIQTDTQSNISLTPSDIGWIASAPPLASLFGTVISSPIMEKWGRRNTITMLAIPFVLGWLIVGTSINFAMIFVGRLSGGIALGMARATAPVYVSETARAKHRGKLGYLPPIMSALGVLLGCMLSSSVNWKTLALLMTSFPILLFATSLFLPESPHWLIRQNQEDKAYQELSRLRYRRGNVNDDFLTFKEISEIRESLEDTSPFPEKNQSLLHLLQKPNIRFPATLVFLLMIFQQFSGVSAVIYYMKMILNHGSAGGIPHPPPRHGDDMRPAIVGLVHLAAFFITLPLVDKLGRKILLKISGVLMTASHIVLAVYLYVYCESPSATTTNMMSNSLPASEELGPLTQRAVPDGGNEPKETIMVGDSPGDNPSDFASVHSLVPLLSLCAYIASFSLASPIPYILMSEIFGTNVRSYLCSAAMLVCSLASFLVVLLFPPLMYGLSPTLTFVIFAVFSFQTTTIGYIIPETKGKSLAEIENLFRGPRDFHGKVKESVELPSCSTACCLVMTPPPQNPSSATVGTNPDNKEGVGKY